jgi:hypothetical protein
MKNSQKTSRALSHFLYTQKGVWSYETHLSSEAERGFESLRDDLAKLRQKNREVIPERHLHILDRSMQLVAVAGTVIIAVAVIYAVWFVISSTGMDAVTRVVSWVLDFLKLAKVMT